MSVNSVGAGAIAATIQSPQFSKSSQVMARIEQKVGQITDLFANLQAIIAELEALEPPSAPGEGATEAEKSSYNNKLEAFQGKVAQLNKNIEDVSEKLTEAQSELDSLQQQDLPTAERQDAQNLKNALEQAKKAMEAAFSEVDDRGKKSGDQSDLTSSVARRQVSIGVVRQQNLARLVIRVGDAGELPENKSETTTKMPPTPARGI